MQSYGFLSASLGHPKSFTNATQPVCFSSHYLEFSVRVSSWTHTFRRLSLNFEVVVNSFVTFSCWCLVYFHRFKQHNCVSLLPWKGSVLADGQGCRLFWKTSHRHLQRTYPLWWLSSGKLRVSPITVGITQTSSVLIFFISLLRQ